MAYIAELTPYIANQRYYRYYIGITRASADTTHTIYPSDALKAAMNRAKRDKRDRYINPTKVDVLTYGSNVSGATERDCIAYIRSRSYNRTILNKGNGGEGVKAGINVLYIRSYKLKWYQVLYDGLCDVGNRLCTCCKATGSV